MEQGRIMCLSMGEMTRVEKVANLGAVIVPFLAVLTAIALLWNDVVNVADLIIAAAMYLLTAVGITVGFHRLLTHRSFQTSRRFEYAFAVLLTSGVAQTMLKGPESPILRQEERELKAQQKAGALEYLGTMLNTKAQMLAFSDSFIIVGVVALLALYIIIKQAIDGNFTLDPFVYSNNTAGWTGFQNATLLAILAIAAFDIVAPMAEETRRNTSSPHPWPCVSLTRLK